MSEFDLIRRYFTRAAPAGTLGVGDDCALLPAAAGAWAVSTDLLLEGRHFFPDVPPRHLGHKALAVNLSDLAAMGAAPRGCVLGLALPGADADWLAAFADGFHALAARHACPLVGGDTTRSEVGIAISVTVFGALDARRALRRDAAREGDDVWVSGELGCADLALRLAFLRRGRPAPPAPAAGWPAALADDAGLDGWLAVLDPARADALFAATLPRLETPEPRVALGERLAGVAHAAVDVSDGLVQDLGHVATASRCRAVIEAARLPLAPALAALPAPVARRAALTGGDAYELCFTAPAGRREAVLEAARRARTPVTRIGRMEAGEGVAVLGEAGEAVVVPGAGFDHFADRPDVSGAPR